MSFLIAALVVIAIVGAGVLFWMKRPHAEALPGFARTESDNSADAMFEQGGSCPAHGAFRGGMA